MKAFFLALLLVATAAPASSQDCITGAGNIFNDTAIVTASAAADLDPTDRIVALSDTAGCVGEADPQPQPGASAIPITIWLDDPITPELDGLPAGENAKIYARKENGTLLPLVSSLPHTGDGVFEIMQAAFDTTTVALLDDMFADLALMELELDSLYAADSTVIAEQSALITQQSSQITTQAAQISSLQQTLSDSAVELLAAQDALGAANTRADSLQAVVDGFPDVSDLQNQLAAANAMVSDLEAEAATTNARLELYRDLFARLLEAVNRNGNKYKDILDILNSN